MSSEEVRLESTIAAFGAGRILGLDAYIEQYDIGGGALVERYPWTRYLLG